MFADLFIKIFYYFMSKKTKIILIVVCCLLLVVSCFVYVDYHNKKTEVVFFDVGQGDSILINLLDNNEILIDGGPDNTILYKLGNYLPIYNRDIELMILTHPHADHLVGLVEVLKRYKVKKVMFNQVEYNSEIYENFLSLISKLEIEILNPADFSELELIENNFLKVLYPQEDLSNEKFKNQNDNSIVLKFLAEDEKSFLFTGDTEEKIEEKLILNFEDELNSDILKIGHHGSNTSSGLDFLKAVLPDWAVISVGENSFGHPSQRVIKRLERIDAEIFRTDEDGDVVIKVNNE